MKLMTPLIVVSIAANVVLGWLIIRPTGGAEFEAPAAHARTSAKEAPAFDASERATPARAGADLVDGNTALRDRLRALGFSAEAVRAAVRAHLEAPRLARQRAFLRETAKQPWWRGGLAAPNFSPEQTRELLELRNVERAEITRVLGPAGLVTPADIERYPFLPEEKAARLAVLERDYNELRREAATRAGAPTARAESQEREKLLKAEYERDLAALLTPQERDEVGLRTSNAAHSIGRGAAYFSGTEAEYRQIYELQKAYHDAWADSSWGDSKGVASRKLHTDMETALGPERHAQWQRAQQTDYTALVELQRRFSLPAATVDAVAAVSRQISDEGMRIARDRERSNEQKLAALRELANEGRGRVRAILGPDLGDAYNEASAGAWLDHLERGYVPYYMANGQRALFLVPRLPRTPSPGNSPVPPTPAPKR